MAGAYFYERVIANTVAKGDREHIPVVLWGDPRVPDRTAHLLEQKEDPVPALAAGAAALYAMHAEILAIPCNTAHAFLRPLHARVGGQILDMPRLSVSAVKAKGGRRIGLLSTRGTALAGVYRIPAEECGLPLILPSPEDAIALETLIYRQKAGRTIPAKLYMQYAKRLCEAGADTVILACTEISAAMRGGYPQWVTDSLEVLAKEAVGACREPKDKEEGHAVLRAFAG